MQNVRKKVRRSGPQGRLTLLIAALLLLVGLTAAVLLLGQENAETPLQRNTAQNLFEYAPAQVVSISIVAEGEPSWTATQTENGLLTVAGEDSLPLSVSTSGALLDAASLLACTEVLTEDPAEYRNHLADFGLDTPRYEAIVTYSDGIWAHLRIGNPGVSNNAWYYMTVEGDDRLFAVSRGTVESLCVSRDSLQTVESPTIHKARIDRITLTRPTGVIQWDLDGDIADADAIDKWRITAPISYPADARTMTTLLSNLANLRLGAYVCAATPENLSLYGFDAPRLTIDVHMAEGTIGFTNADGAVEATDYPASTVTYVIGGAKNDMVDYVRYGDAIYISSHFTMGVFIDYDETLTMSRYPVMTALGNLASLSIREGDSLTEYVLARTEQVAENNELVTDADGNLVYDVTVKCNGKPIDYTAFAAAYNALSLVTVSGTLPDGETSTADPHTVCTFTDVDGTVHTVTLATFDVLHDAVIVDGHQAFYLIKDGFKLNLK